MGSSARGWGASVFIADLFGRVASTDRRALVAALFRVAMIIEASIAGAAVVIAVATADAAWLRLFAAAAIAGLGFDLVRRLGPRWRAWVLPLATLPPILGGIGVPDTMRNMFTTVLATVVIAWVIVVPMRWWPVTALAVAAIWGTARGAWTGLVIESAVSGIAMGASAVAIAHFVMAGWARADDTRAAVEMLGDVLESLPVVLFLQDFSKVPDAIARIERQTGKPIEEAMDHDPLVVREVLGVVRTTYANPIAGRLAERDPAELVGPVSETRLLSGRPNAYANLVVALATGAREYSAVMELNSYEGSPLTVQIRWYLPGPFPESLERAIVTAIDLTESVRIHASCETSTPRRTSSFRRSATNCARRCRPSSGCRRR